MVEFKGLPEDEVGISYFCLCFYTLFIFINLWILIRRRTSIDYYITLGISINILSLCCKIFKTNSLFSEEFIDWLVIMGIP